MNREGDLEELRQDEWFKNLVFIEDPDRYELLYEKPKYGFTPWGEPTDQVEEVQPESPAEVGEALNFLKESGYLR